MKLELRLPFELRATHCLEEREQPHEHLWRVRIAVEGPVHEGRVLSLPVLHNQLEPIFEVLRGTHLNENPALDPQTRSTPTCECLAIYLADKVRSALNACALPAVRVSEVTVAVEEPDGTEYGSVRLTL